MPVALGTETEGRLRVYFGALLRPDEIDRAVNSVTLRIVPSATVVEAFVAAHTVLGLYLRVAVDVEADVLVRDVGLTTEQAARVVGLTEAEVTAAVAAAEAFLAEEGGGTVLAPGDADTQIDDVLDAGAVDTTGDEAEREEASDEVAAGDVLERAEHEDEDPDDAVEAAAHALRAERHLAPADDDSDATADPDIETARPWVSVGGNGHRVARSVVVIDADEDEDVGDEAPVLVPRGRGRLYALAALVLVLSFAVGLAGYFTLQEIVTTPVTVTDHAMTTSIGPSGEPDNERDAFTVGERILLWMTYEVPDEPVRVGIQVYRGEEPLQASPAVFDLPMNGGMTYPVSGRLVDTPGSYRIELTSDGEVVVSEEFDVEAA